MNERYEPQSIEPRWQARWDEAGVFRAGRRPRRREAVRPRDAPVSRPARCTWATRASTPSATRSPATSGCAGFDVLHPMGFDALGLPAENAAIKDGRHPAERTRENIVAFRAEMKRLGYCFDWDREIVTADPEYYRWNQWFFVKMLEQGIVYRRVGKANWCTGCLTVIANEQVVEDDRCERCGSPVVEKEHPGVGVPHHRVRAGAARRARHAEGVARAHHRRCSGTGSARATAPRSTSRSPGAEPIKVFTTRVDTIFGCTYVVLAPEHPLVEKVTAPERQAEVRAFVERMRKTDAAERTGEGAPKEGVFTGAHAVNPYNGEEVPVWIANFVLAEYGTGAVMSVPAHDQRDFEFARKYGLPDPRRHPAGARRAAAAGRRARGGVTPRTASSRLRRRDRPRVGRGARRGSRRRREQKGFGQATVRWHLRDWGFSRQRYWGTPIPIVYCQEHGAVPVPEDQLPVVLPDEAIITGTGEPPLAKVPEFVNTTCPRCGKPARREAETMDTFVDSSWYYARYLSPQDDHAPVRSRRGEALAAGRRVRRRPRARGDAPALLPLLAPGDARARARPRGRAGAAARHAGHRERPRRPQDVEALGQRRRSRARWSRASAPTRCGSSCCSRRRSRRTSTGPTSRWRGCSGSSRASGASSTRGRTRFGAPAAALAQASGAFLELRRRTHRTIKQVTEGVRGRPEVQHQHRRADGARERALPARAAERPRAAPRSARRSSRSRRCSRPSRRTSRRSCGTSCTGPRPASGSSPTRRGRRSIPPSSPPTSSPSPSR